jgi:S-adenosylmethionine:tRNA ribosyltransferase-isomerase
MQVSDFDYHLPEELIALEPLKKRDESRLLVFNNGKISDKNFTDLPEYLQQNDILVLNDTKVIPARLDGVCGAAKVEITLLKKQQSGDEIWEVLAKPAKKLIIGEKFIISENFDAEIISKKESGEVLLKFNKSGAEFFQLLYKHGSMPLPPYIAKKRKADKSDDSTYQTTYANKTKEGSVAAPTAGLHFTKELLEKINNKGVDVEFVTLHVGAGTFLPVRVENIKDHKMHSEFYEVSQQAADKINNARKKGGRVIAVGTTSLRTLESVADESGYIKSGSGETNIFIYPGYKFKIVDALVTNFHLPKSTLFMLVSAFVGAEKAKDIYQHAINKKYRFFSYGDGSFLMRDKIVS